MVGGSKKRRPRGGGQRKRMAHLRFVLSGKEGKGQGKGEGTAKGRCGRGTGKKKTGLSRERPLVKNGLRENRQRCFGHSW